MATEDSTRPLPTHEEVQAIAAALDSVTSTAATSHQADPQVHIHLPATHKDAHPWLSRFISPSTIEFYSSNYHLGNYVIDRHTGEKTFEAMSIYVRLGMHLLYYGSVQQRALHWQRVQGILKAESDKMGRLYDAPESKAHIEPFIKSFDLRESLADMEEPDPGNYATFNDFFARKIKDEARPVQDEHDEHVTSSPADCRLTAFPSIDLATKYWIKGFGFTVGRLVNHEELAKEFDGGAIVIARLAPQDYHRWHSPVTGVVESVTEIPGTYYTVNPQAVNEPGTMDVFCENRRSVMVIRRAATNRRVIIVAVGAMLVGSIKYVGGVEKPGSEVKRGQCLGAFYYGGSTVVVLYQKGDIGLDEDLVKNSTHTQGACETLMRVGWRVGGKGE